MQAQLSPIESVQYPNIINKLDAALLKFSDIGVMLLDLTDFTQINVGLGFTAGDMLLNSFKQRLSMLSCGLFSIEHYYADKFIIILPTVKSDRKMERYANILINYFAKNSVDINSLEVPVDIKIAYMVAPSDAVGKRLLQSLEWTMFGLKQKNIHIEKAASSEEHDLENIYKNVSRHSVVRRAIENGEIRNYYQPIVNLDSSEIVAVESLVRWDNPIMGLMPPSSFLPHISKHHQMINLTVTILTGLINDFSPILSRLPEGFYISVNLPPSILIDNRAMNKIISYISGKGFPFKFIGFELTEQHLLSSTEQVESVINKLNDLGAKILIDDFGTGHSSIERIARFSVYGIKVDKQFLLNKKTIELNNTVIRFALDVARQKKAIVVCEGVADEEILMNIKSLGVKLGQGFHFWKAISFEHLKELLLK